MKKKIKKIKMIKVLLTFHPFGLPREAIFAKQSSKLGSK
jgi:hypothetical protein